MHKRKKSTLLEKMSLVFLILCGSIACNESTDIGSNLISSNDLNNVLQTDTFSLQLSTIESDTIRTAPMIDFENNLARYYAVGSLNDDVFGQTPGTVILGPYTQSCYDIFIIDENNDNCAQNVFGNSTCVQPNCDLDVILDFECVNEDEYNVLVTVLGTGTGVTSISGTFTNIDL